jgi:hypothetical protein
MTRVDVLALVAIVIASISRALKEDLPAVHSIAPKWRALLVLALGIVSGIVDAVVTGSPFAVAAMTVLKTSAPSFVLLLVETLLGGGGAVDGGGTLSAGGKNSLKPDAPAGPYSHMVRHHLVAIACACMSLVLFTGCINPSQIPQWIQSALVIMQNLSSIVSALRSAADLFLMTSNPSDAVKQSVEKAFTDVELAEAGVTELLNAGQDVTQLQLDAAREKVLAAYSNLTKLLADLGAVNVADAAGTLKATTGDGAQIGTPLLARERIVK